MWPWFGIKRGRVVNVTTHPALAGWLAKARAPVSVMAQYLPDRFGLEP